MGLDLSEQQVSLILAMVDRSARALCPDEWDDAFEEYAEQVAATSRLPGAEPGRMDDSAAGIVDAGLFFGIGLALLGQVAAHVLRVLADLGVEKGAESGLEWLRRRLRRADDALPAETAGAQTGQAGAGDVGPRADQVADLIAPAVGEQVPQLSIEVVRTIVRIQLGGGAAAAPPETRWQLPG